MKYELYDILTLTGKDYSILSMIVDEDFEYFLLNEIDKEENLIVGAEQLIVGHSLVGPRADDRLFVVENKEKLQKLSKLLLAAMMNDIKEGE